MKSQEKVDEHIVVLEVWEIAEMMWLMAEAAALGQWPGVGHKFNFNVEINAIEGPALVSLHLVELPPLPAKVKHSLTVGFHAPVEDI